MSQRSQDPAAKFLASSRTTDGVLMDLKGFHVWFEELGEQGGFAVKKIPFSALDQWFFASEPHRLAHRSGKFFTIEGLGVETNWGQVRSWQQPIIHQPEIGILGILTRTFDGVAHFLMQAKMEPGNINTLQLSPTVQATKSNYTRVHEGKAPLYLEYFLLDRPLGKVQVDQLQSEQGSRFLRKRNRNMLVEVEGEIPLHEGFCWLTLGQIKELLKVDNLVNMDARTVLSCIPLADPEAAPEAAPDSKGDFARGLVRSMNAHSSRHRMSEVLSWWTELKTHCEMEVHPLALDQLAGWRVGAQEIRHESGQFFSVIAVAVEAGTREVVRWTQPLLEHHGFGLVGFLVQELDGVLHFLVRASLEPGNRDLFEMGPTVACANPEERLRGGTAPTLLEQFIDPPPEQVRYSAVQSEEGGRFYHFQNRYVIRELPVGTTLETGPEFCWLTLRQIFELAQHGYFNIEARNLLACLNFSDLGPTDNESCGGDEGAAES